MFPTGANPYFVVFDGANVWVTNFGSDSVTKMRANNGMSLGTFSLGGEHTGMTFDGSNIWVANDTASTVTKMRASDRTVLGTFAINPGNPIALAFHRGGRLAAAAVVSLLPLMLAAFVALVARSQ